MNVRFNEFINGDVIVITLVPGGFCEHTEGGRTEEGFQYTSTEWSFDAERGLVTRQTHTQACDCDGRMDTSVTCTCPVTELRANAYAGCAFPAWKRGSARQRDYSAEAAGY